MTASRLEAQLGICFELRYVLGFEPLCDLITKRTRQFEYLTIGFFISLVNPILL